MRTMTLQSLLWKIGNMRFLRLSPVSEKVENNLKGESEFLCYLQNRSYPAVIPVAYGKAPGQLHILSAEYSPENRK